MYFSKYAMEGGAAVFFVIFVINVDSIKAVC